MRAVCLVNSFNYERFLSECLDSLVRQHIPFDQVVIVDDGSTDGSRELIESYCQQHPGWHAVFKQNAGQLSCFNAARPFVRPDDLVTLLDADDVYPPDYLGGLLARAQALNADFYFADVVNFCSGTEQPIASSLAPTQQDWVMPCSSALTRALGIWMGSPTSALAMTGRLFMQLFPYPHERDWITRADDVAVFGSSLLGASKAYLPSLRVAYRVHGANHFHGRRYSPGYRAARDHKLEKLFGWYCDLQHIERQAERKRVLSEYLLVAPLLAKRLGLPAPKRFMTWPERLSAMNRRRKLNRK